MRGENLTKKNLINFLKKNNEKHNNYISYLKNKFYMYRKKYLGYDLKYVPGNMEFSKEFNDLIIFLDK